MLQIFFIISVIFAVSCESCTLGDVRFVGGTDASNGLLEMCNDNTTWTEVCGWSFDCDEAIVACRKAGYVEAISEYTRFANPRELTEFGLYSCTGSESSLLDCPLDTFWRGVGALEQLHLCGHWRVGINCAQSIVAASCMTEDEVRLINGFLESEGQLQICKNQYWRDVCTSSSRGYETNLGIVACRQLGYTDTLVSVSDNGYYYNSSINPEQFTRINCDDSTYANVSSCSVNSKCVQCKGSEISVKCVHQSTDCANGDLRLFGGPNLLEGSLEICIDGIWGGVINNIEGNTKDVACATMGFNETGATVIGYHNYVKNHSPLFVKYINCCEDDENFEDCNIQYVNHNEDSFTHNNLLGLRCIDGCTAGDMRLTGGESSIEGVVEVCVDGTWTLVGLDSWDDRDANVVCQNINNEKSNAFSTAVNSSTFIKPHRPVRYDRFQCIGTESSLLNCGKSWHYETNDEEVAAVLCGCFCGNKKRSVGLEIHNDIRKRDVDEESHEDAQYTSCNYGDPVIIASVIASFVGGIVFGKTIIIIIVILILKFKKDAKLPAVS